MKTLINVLLIAGLTMSICLIGTLDIAAKSTSACSAHQIAPTAKKATKRIYTKGRWVTTTTWVNGKRISRRVWRKGSSLSRKVVEKTRTIVVGPKQQTP